MRVDSDVTATINARSVNNTSYVSEQTFCVTPVDREVSLLSRYSQLSQYPIVSAVDPIRIRLWDQPIPGARGDVEKISVKREFSDAVDSDTFDTFLVGNLPCPALRVLLQVALHHGKKLWPLQEIPEDLLAEYSEGALYICGPLASNQIETPVEFPKKSFNSNLPRLLIAVTRGGMQPLEVHLALVEALLIDGYDILGLTTEPIGGIFGFSTVACSIKDNRGVDADQIVSKIDPIVRSLCKQYADADILVASSNLPLTCEETIYSMSFSALAFANAFRPLAIILHCTYYDGYKYLRNLIDQWYLSTGANVIGLTLANNLLGIRLPFNFRPNTHRTISNDKLTQKASELSQELGRPVVSMSEENAGAQIRSIIESYFAGTTG